MAARRFRRTLCLIALGALLLLSPAAVARAVLVTGSDRYVRIVHLGGGQLSVALTAQGRRTFTLLMRGGYALSATCTRLGPSVQGFSQRSSSSSDEAGIGAAHLSHAP